MSARFLAAIPAAAVLLTAAAWALPALAVIIDSGDGSGNTSAPADDPGFANVGQNAGFSGVYLGDGWILTAAHANHVNARFAGVLYQALAGSEIVLDHPTLAAQSDLKLYRLESFPALSAPTIRGVAVNSGESVIMAGRGRDRGAAFSFQSPPTQDDGYYWSSVKTRRWGTNEVGLDDYELELDGRKTNTFVTFFDRNQPDHEAQASDGDSGGAVFIKRLGSWELAGIMVAATSVQGQPANSAAYGNATFAADLSQYRDQILAVTTPECGNGILTIDEECDDGNTTAGDCCSSTCQFETGGSPCEDGLSCTGGDVCDGAGLCSAGSGNPCDDGVFCNGEEICDEGSGCTAGEPPPLDDGIACTIDSCVELAGAVLHEPDDDACDDGDACTACSCDAQLGCVHTAIFSGGCSPLRVPSAGPPGHAILLVGIAAIGAVLAARLAIPNGAQGPPSST